MNIALFGFMGVGKSRVGRILADRLGLTFTDIDQEIVNRTGKTIPDIFEENGESSFRDIERCVTEEVSARDCQVIACGGGTVLHPESLKNLRRKSVMILLTADPKTILERVENCEESRPLLETDNKLERIRKLLSARHRRYLMAADMVIDTTNWTAERVSEEILQNLEGVKETYESRDQTK